MRNFSLRALIFLIGLSIFLLGYDALRTKACQSSLGYTSGQRIEKAFTTISNSRPLEVVTFGNSRIYRGVAIENISQKAYNFAFDGETFPQIYWKLNFLEEKGLLPDTIIIGVDYWSFSSTSAHLAWYYAPFLGYSKLMEFGAADYLLYSKRLLKLYFQGSLHYIQSYLFGESKRPLATLSSFGQYIFDLDHDPDAKTKSRSLHLSKRNKMYFEAILNDFHEKSQIIVVQPPYRSSELESMGKEQMQTVKKYFSSHLLQNSIPYFDFSDNQTSFSDSSFYDITHLRLEGSKVLGNLIRTEMNAYYE